MFCSRERILYCVHPVLTEADLSFQHVVSYSISAGSVVNVVAMASQPHLYGTVFPGPWVTDCSPAEVQECFEGWEPEVEEMLKVQSSLNTLPTCSI